MNQIPVQTPKPIANAPETKIAASAELDPSLGASLRDDYDAVQEDLRQTNELAARLEKELAGKSKEMLHLKFLFEQTKSHLAHMHDNIAALRKERHDLATAAMRAKGLEIMLKSVTEERDRLKNEIDGVLDGLASENARKGLTFDKRDHRIAELTIEVMTLKQQVEELRRANPRPAPVPAPAREMPLKTSAEEFTRLEPETEGMEIIATERVGGHRG